MIYGERVRLRSVEREDLPRFVEWLNDPEVRAHLALVYPLGLAQEQEWFEADRKREPALQTLAIDARPGPADPQSEPAWSHVGACGFHQIDWRGRSGELGLVLGNRAAWGRGLGADATRAFARWGFLTLNLNRVWLRVYENNARAVRCYEKVGFRVEGRLRQDRYEDGQYLDTLVMGLLRSELPK